MQLLNGELEVYCILVDAEPIALGQTARARLIVMTGRRAAASILANRAPLMICEVGPMQPTISTAADSAGANLAEVRIGAETQ